uniref:RNase_Zc3h12a_2 domain-containing protein n=1 Tax=Steinernema glaseri TaxID=37863 RepID=A0A1I7ZV60_9BILA
MSDDDEAQNLLDKKLAELFQQLETSEPQKPNSTDPLSVIATSGFLGGGGTKVCLRSSPNRLLRPIVIDGLGLQFVANQSFCAANLERFNNLKNGKAKGFEYKYSRLNVAILLKALFYLISKGHRAVIWLPAIYNPHGISEERLIRLMIGTPETLKILHRHGLLRFFSGDNFAPMIEEVLETDAILCTRARAWEQPCDLYEFHHRRDFVMRMLILNTESLKLINADLLDRFIEPCYNEYDQNFMAIAYCHGKFRSIPQGFFVREHAEGSDAYTKLLDVQLTFIEQMEKVQLLYELFNKLQCYVNYSEKTAFDALMVYYEKQKQ